MGMHPIKGDFVCSIFCVQFFAHAVFNVVIDACPERSRRDEVQFLICENVMPIKSPLAKGVQGVVFFSLTQNNPLTPLY